MDNRFTLKDFIFVILFFVVIASVVLAIYQYSYQEDRLNGLKVELQRLNEAQKQQLTVLTDMRNMLRDGVRTTSGVESTTQSNTTQASADGRIRRKNPDGSLYVYYPTPPKSPRDPRAASDFSAGDWLVRNLGNEPKVIAPFIEKDYYGQIVHDPVLESLIAQNPETFEYEPLLAESFRQSADGLKFTFKLRNGLTFSDGHPLTVDDVVFSYNTVMTDGVDCAPLRGYYEHVKACKKIDDRTVEFTMDEPYFQAMDFIGGLTIIPQHIYKFDKPEDFNRMGAILIGSGPYMIEKWDRGQQITLVRNEHYWGERPTFDRVVMKFIQNPQTAFHAFENEQIDAVSPDPEQFTKYSKDSEFTKKFTVRLFPRPNAGYAFLGYNLTKPMFKDKQTRQALTMLIDRKAIIHTFLKDLAMEITSPFSTLTPQNDPSIKPWPYDPEVARKKLADAGWKPGDDGVLTRDGVRFEFDLSMGTGNPVAERVANYIKEQFEKAGIRMRITPWEFAVFTGRLDERNFDAAFLSWSGSIEDDPYQIWHSDSIKDKGSNFVGFSNKEADKIIEEARRTLDSDKRMALWHKWQAIIADEQPYTFLQAPKDRQFINGRFKNTEPYKTGLAPYDWYVPAAQQKYH